MAALPADVDPLLRTWELAQMFSVDVRTVRRWAVVHGLPCIWLPTGQRRFRKSAAIAWYRERVDALLKESVIPTRRPASA